MSETDRAPFRTPIVDRIARFLVGIGLPINAAPVPETCFLPGIRIEEGTLTVDEDKLLYPGDLLHEAGHLAILPPDVRAQATGSLEADMGEEMAAQAWSYAAARAVGIPLDVLFHDDGYRGSATWLRDLYDAGGTVGVPLLAWYGMAHESTRNAPVGAPLFPEMLVWLRTTPHPPHPPHGAE
ncbi:MAG: hypothetical protein EP335_16935 [Alphaproteobacteria bacterium]|nr:MAG: hypothetical protein EP335_16935 [Alphaproteobacteria bacterium]